MRLLSHTTLIQATTALVLIATVNAQAATKTNSGYGTIQTLDCYSSVSPLTDGGPLDFASDGECQKKCYALQMPVMAMTAGTTCYCGDTLPAADTQIDESKCNVPCAGYDKLNCGGIAAYQLYLSGFGGAVGIAPNSTSSTTSSTTSTTAPSVPATVVVTQSPTSATQTPSSGPNKVGIAVGVVVGLVAVAGIIGATIFILKQRKKRALEEEHKRNAQVNDFISGKRSEAGSATDSRLDATFLSSHRRESIGSIADEMDFSRRILQVRNPDHRASSASNIA